MDIIDIFSSISRSKVISEGEKKERNRRKEKEKKEKKITSNEETTSPSLPRKHTKKREQKSCYEPSSI
jgi:hypothetical protein